MKLFFITVDNKLQQLKLLCSFQRLGSCWNENFNLMPSSGAPKADRGKMTSSPASCEWCHDAGQSHGLALFFFNVLMF